MKQVRLRSAKEISNLALFLALLIGGQYVFSMFPGVEIVTVLFVAYAFCMGMARGMVAATAFSLLRQLLFGVFLNVLILYLIYFNFLAVIFGRLGDSARKKGTKKLWKITFVACFCTIGFTLLDNVFTPLWYGFAPSAVKAYVLASLPVLLPQIACTFLTVGYLFLPLEKIFSVAAKKLS